MRIDRQIDRCRCRQFNLETLRLQLALYVYLFSFFFILENSDASASRLNRSGRLNEEEELRNKTLIQDLCSDVTNHLRGKLTILFYAFDPSLEATSHANSPRFVQHPHS